MIKIIMWKKFTKLLSVKDERNVDLDLEEIFK